MKLTKTQLKQIIKEELEEATEGEDVNRQVNMSKFQALSQPATPAYVVTKFAGRGLGGTVPVYITADKEAAERVYNKLMGGVSSFAKSTGAPYAMEVWNGPPGEDSEIRRENPTMFREPHKPMKKKSIFSEE